VAPGFVAFGLEAIAGRKLLVATASIAPNTFGGGNKPNGAQVLDALRAELERQSGQSFQTLASLPGVDEAPERAWTLGGVYLADFGSTFTHAQHATSVAPRVWDALVRPWLEGTSSSSSTTTQSDADADTTRDAPPATSTRPRRSLRRVYVGGGVVLAAAWLVYEVLTTKRSPPT
jgi:hypothetical protein